MSESRHDHQLGYHDSQCSQCEREGATKEPTPEEIQAAAAALARYVDEEDEEL